MSGSTTPNYGFALPTVSGDQNVWGNKLNSNWSSVDTILHNMTVAAGSAAYLPLSGGTMVGPLYLSGNPTTGTMPVTLSYLNAQGYIKTTGGASISGGLAATSFEVGYPSVTDFDIYVNGSQRVLQWQSNITDVLDTSSGSRYWNYGSSGTIMYLHNNGDLGINGQGYKPGGGSWGAPSDDRVKRDATPYSAGLRQVCELRPIAFRYNGHGGTTDDGKTYYGLSAQATKPVMPEVVHERAGYLMTELGPLMMALVNACKELAQRVATLEARGA